MAVCYLNSWSWKRIAVCVLAGVAGACGVFLKPNIRDYNAATDREAILRHFNKDNWYWLVEGGYFSPERMLDTHSPHEDLMFADKFKIKVLVERGQVAGFVTYYPITFRQGEIQFVSVGEKFRGKGYGKILTKYAIGDLFNSGCSEVHLVTRINNKWSRRIYQELGFRELGFIDAAQSPVDGLINLKITR